MYFYTLYSLKDKRLYKGVTSDLGNRFIRHNSGGVKSTKNRRPLILVYSEFVDPKVAYKKETYYKSLRGGVELKQKLEKELRLLNKTE